MGRNALRRMRQKCGDNRPVTNKSFIDAARPQAPTPLTPDIQEFFAATREKFPSLAEATNKRYLDRVPDEDFELAFLWFEELAEVLNGEMREGVLYCERATLFVFLAQKLAGGSDEIRDYIDVAIVENLFWNVPAERAAPWWREMPATLKELYIGFHQRPPC